jgi:MFS transporter, FSR family, fosmidomycin resistance protein
MLTHGLFHTYELSIPLFISIWLDRFSTTTATIGLIVGLGYGLVGVGALPSGLLADRYGSQRLMITSAIGMGSSFALLSFAPSIEVIAVAIAVWGITASLYHPLALWLISRGTNNRSAAFAYHGVGGNIGTAFGPLVVALLLAVLNWRMAAAFLTLPAIVVVTLGYRIRFEERLAEAGGRSEIGPSDFRSVLVRSRRLFTLGFALVFLVVMSYGVYYHGLLTFLPDMIASLPNFQSVSLFGYALEPAQYVYTGLLMIGILGQYSGGHRICTNRVRPAREPFCACGGRVAFLTRQ